jgi:hypothetical protein
MKKLYALCLLTLLAVAVDVFLFHASPAKAQGVGTVNIIKTTDQGKDWTVNVADKRVVGVSCIRSESAVTTCYLAVAQ